MKLSQKFDIPVGCSVVNISANKVRYNKRVCQWMRADLSDVLQLANLSVNICRIYTVFYIYLCNGLFTHNMCVPVCVNINVNFNIVLMVTQMHMQRMGLKPIPCISHWLNVKVDVYVDTNGHVHVTCKQSLKCILLSKYFLIRFRTTSNADTFSKNQS